MKLFSQHRQGLPRLIDGQNRTTPQTEQQTEHQEQPAHLGDSG